MTLALYTLGRNSPIGEHAVIAESKNDALRIIKTCEFASIYMPPRLPSDGTILEHMLESPIVRGTCVCLGHD